VFHQHIFIPCLPAIRSLGERMANVGKAVHLVLIDGFGNMNQIELSPHCQSDPQRMCDAFTLASEKSVGWTMV
jgi:hypothetical protein